MRGLNLCRTIVVFLIFVKKTPAMRNILLLVFINLLTLTIAQKTYNVTELETTKGKTRGSSFVGIDQDGFIYTTSYKTIYIGIGLILRDYVKVFNARTGEMHAEAQLEKSSELKDRGLKYLDFEFFNGKPIIVCEKLNEKESETLYGIEIDRNGWIKGDAFRIGEAANCTKFTRQTAYTSNKIYLNEIENGNLIFISELSCDSDELKSFKVLELNKSMEVDNEFSFSLDHERIEDLSFVKNDDNLYIKVETSAKQKVDGKLLKRWITTHHLYKVSTKDGAIEEIDVLKNFEPQKIGDFRMKALPEGVLLSGQIIQEKGFAGLFTALLETNSDKLTDIQVENFDPDFVSKYWSDRQKRKSERKSERKGEPEDDDFSNNFQLMDYFVTSDNGLISIFQEYEVRRVTTTSTDQNGVTTTRTSYYYYYKDVIIVKTKADGSIEYTELLPFYQLTIDYDPGKGYSVINDGNDIYFLHGTSDVMEEMIEEGRKSGRKSKRKERKIQYASVTHLSSEGNIDTEQVLDVNEEDVSIDPNNIAVDERNKQFVIVSPVMKMFNRKKTKVIQIEL